MQMSRNLASWLGVMILSVFCVTHLQASPVIIDDFNDAGGWELILADGVQGELTEENGTLRLDYDFTAGVGYCVLRKVFNHTLDSNYRFGLRYRGDGPRNTLEFKLLDSSMENVWWSVKRDFVFPREWETRSLRRRHFSFAWGPSGGDVLDEFGAIEIAVTASSGGRGCVWFDRLSYEALPKIEPTPSEPIATAQLDGSLGRLPASGALEWNAIDDNQLELRFDQLVEFSAIRMHWDTVQGDPVYQITTSVDGQAYVELPVERIGCDGLRQVFTPDREARVVRVQLWSGSAQLNCIEFVPVEAFADANAYFQRLADDARDGAYPQYFDALSPWTVVGLPDQPHEALMSATGAVEPMKAGYSLEPFILIDDDVKTWADANRTQRLEEGALPIPSVRWSLDDLELEITSLVTDRGGTELLLVRYQVHNVNIESQSLGLVLATRPLQVLPAAQFLNTVGGAAYADRVVAEPTGISINSIGFMTPVEPADGVITHAASRGLLVDSLGQSSAWYSEIAESIGQFPSGALRWDMTLRPGESRTIDVALAMGGEEPIKVDEHGFDRSLEHERLRWTELLHRFELLVPQSVHELRDTIRANLAYILINADGARIRPGSRSYDRSWIRDGAMTSAALIALGNQQEARAFIDWYSGYQFSNGKVPCVVDSRGPDPVDENDAPGEYLFAIRNSIEAGGEYDESFARAIYPSVLRTVEYIEWMRDQRLTPVYTESDDDLMRARAGLMPESISHEGYSAKPMHSYWDDFWVYRGLRDAEQIAERLGEHEDSEAIERLADQFGISISESIGLATKAHGIDYVPGCVELGDFDATSTSIAFYPTGAAGLIDSELLMSTFERAWESTRARMGGDDLWDGMTPYEVRTIGTFVRLGWIERAHEYMDWLLTLQAPRGWHQWGEIAYREDEPCRFVGDMPHTWVGSGAILSILSMFSYEKGDTLVLGAGIPRDWIESGETLGVRGLVTRYGVLSYLIEHTETGMRLRIEPGCVPSGGFRVRVDQFGSGKLSISGELVDPDQDGFVHLRSDDLELVWHR